MTITIYDYANRPVKVDLPSEKIISVHIDVITGDETGSVYFSDADPVDFDASDDRLMDFYDGSYIVEGENLKKWLNFKPSGKRTFSYERQEMFEDWEG